MALAKKEPETGRLKFTADRKAKILEAYALGASSTTVAALAKISVETLYRWLRRGEDAPEDSMWNEFYLAVQEAKALPRERALKIVHNSMPDYPQLAWKYIERVEPGYAPPSFANPAASGPVVIQLSFSDGAPFTAIAGGPPDREVIDVEPAEPTALPAP